MRRNRKRSDPKSGVYVKGSTLQFPIISEFARRSLALKDARFRLLAQRLQSVNDLAAVDKILVDNEEEELDQEFIDIVMHHLPNYHAVKTHRYLQKVHKLVKLNTFILSEQVRVFQQIRDCNLSMQLRFPYPIIHGEGNIEDALRNFQIDAVSSEYTQKSAPVSHNPPHRSLMRVPMKMEPILTSKTLKCSDHGGSGVWKNPANTSRPVTAAKCDPMSYTLVLDCNALRPHQDVSLPMVELNPLKTIPPIRTSLKPGSKPTSNTTNFILPKVDNFSSQDSGMAGSSHILGSSGMLDPSKYL